MKVSEIRLILKNYSNEELVTLVVEMYKSIPKKVKEEKEIDELIKDIRSAKKKTARKKETQIDFNELKGEIEQFISDAYNQYYISANSYVPKKERPKWRYKVKRFMKELRMLQPANRDQEVASVHLMKELYELVCYACGGYVFNTEDPFLSVGIEQAEFYDEVISRNFQLGKNTDSITFAIELILNNDLDRYTLYEELISKITDHLNLPDLNLIAIEQSQKLLETLQSEKKKPTTGFQFDKEIRDYKLNDKINILVQLEFRCYIELAQYGEAISFFLKNNLSRDKEVQIYSLLDLLFEYSLKDQWIDVYENAVKNAIEPRESLQNTYHFIKKTDAFPECSL